MTAGELIALQDELALVKAQLQELRAVLPLVSDPDGTTRLGAIRCSSLEVIGQEGALVAKLSGTSRGGTLMINDAWGASRALVTCESAGGVFIALHANGGIAGSITAVGDGGGIVLGAKADDTVGRGAVCLMGSSQGGWLQLSRSDGTPAATLCSEKEGARLELFRADEQRAACLDVTTQGGSLKLADGSGRNAVQLETNEFGGSLACFAYGTQASAQIFMGEHGGVVTVFDAAQKPVAYLGPDEDGGGQVLVSTPDRGGHAVLVGQADGGHLALTGPDRTVQSWFRASDSGGQMILFNELGIKRCSLGVKDDGGLLGLIWGGNPGIAAMATEKGGVLIVNDGDGNLQASLPPRPDLDDGD